MSNYLQEPLAALLRPKNLDEFIGQSHLVGGFIKFAALLFGLGLIFQWEKSLFKKESSV